MQLAELNSINPLRRDPDQTGAVIVYQQEFLFLEVCDDLPRLFGGHPLALRQQPRRLRRKIRAGGVGAGAGSTLNIPLPAGMSAADYRRAFSDAVRRAFDSARPDLVIISAGYDCLAGDPLGGLLLEPADIYGMTREVMELAQGSAAGRIAALLEGGYVPKRAGAGVVATLRALAGLEL